MTYLFWELTRHPEWQTRLHTELSAQKPWMNDTPLYNEVSDLPVLSAVINEALRLHPAAPASLPRATPPAGRVLNGYRIPSKVRKHFQTLLTFELTVVYPFRLLFQHNVTQRSVTQRSSTALMYFSQTGGRIPNRFQAT